MARLVSAPPEEVVNDLASISKRRKMASDISSTTVDLICLKGAVETIPVTSADAERGFSTMNVISSSLRNRLGVLRVSNLLSTRA